MQFTREEIEDLRDKTFCRTPALRVHSIPEALDFVNRVGFCFAFKAHNSELPCLWHAACGERQPEYPLHSHHDPYIGLVWEAKDVLPAQQKIYYGKALKNRPTMISLEFLPCFYRLHGHNGKEEAYLRLYMQGQLSSEAKKIMEALLDNPPMITADLKLASGMAHPDKRAAFDRAMAELQMHMLITKIAEFYDPFTFLWDIFANRYHEQVTAAAKISENQARLRILQQFFTLVYVAQPAEIRRLFGWPSDDIQEILDELLTAGFICNDLTIRNEKGTFYGLRQLK
ncbi:MAG TPA: hypothetical protein PLP19_17290 [bacterium]|nr:hypothetical protein [bacterium]HPN45249.1 hypothetical protein [bacterium]